MLCEAYTTSEKRSGYRIIEIEEGIQKVNLPRVLFTEIIGHEDLIDFMSSYQRTDENGKHYHPRGYLCWYECNSYGEQKGQIYIIKRVPEFIYIFNFSDKGFQKLKRERARVKTMAETFSREPRASPMKFTDYKSPLSQKFHEKRRSKRRKKKRGAVKHGSES